MVNRNPKPFSMLFLFMTLLLMSVGCSTDKERIFINMHSNIGPLEENGEVGSRWLKAISSDFHQAYEQEQPWRFPVVNMLGTAYKFQEGPKTYNDLPPREQKELTGLNTFLNKAEKKGGITRYLARLTLRSSRIQPQESSEINWSQFPVYQNFSMAEYIRETFVIVPTKDFPAIYSSKSSIIDQDRFTPLYRALFCLHASQYYLTALAHLPEGGDRADLLRERISNSFDQTLVNWNNANQKWNANWKQNFKTPVISAEYQQQFVKLMWQNNSSSSAPSGIEATSEGDQMPFREMHNFDLFRLSTRVRDLHTSAVESFVQGRIESASRYRILMLAYLTRDLIIEQLTAGDPSAKRASFQFRNDYAVDALLELQSLLQR